MRLLLPVVGLLVLELAPALRGPACDGWGEWLMDPPVCKAWVCGVGEKAPDVDCDWDAGGGGGTMGVLDGISRAEGGGEGDGEEGDGSCVCPLPRGR